MKKSLSIMALVLASFGFAPSGFCAPKAKSDQSKIEKAKKPKKETKTAKNQQKHRYQKIIINDTVLDDTTSPPCINENYLLAPKAKILDSSVLAFEENLEVVELPEIRHVGPFAFCKCTNLKKVILGDKLIEVSPSAFQSCHPDLKIIHKGKEYSHSEFFTKNKLPILPKPFTKITKPPQVKIPESIKPLYKNINPLGPRPTYIVHPVFKPDGKGFCLAGARYELKKNIPINNDTQEPTVVEDSIEE